MYIAAADLYQVDAHLSYDSKALYDKAMILIDMYAARGELRLPSSGCGSVDQPRLQLQ